MKKEYALIILNNLKESIIGDKYIIKKNVIINDIIRIEDGIKENEFY